MSRCFEEGRHTRGPSKSLRVTSRKALCLKLGPWRQHRATPAFGIEWMGSLRGHGSMAFSRSASVGPGRCSPDAAGGVTEPRGGRRPAAGGWRRGACRRERLVSQGQQDSAAKGSAKINEKAKEIQQKVQQGRQRRGNSRRSWPDVLEDTAKQYDPYLNQLHDLKPPGGPSRKQWNDFHGRDRQRRFAPDPGPRGPRRRGRRPATSLQTPHRTKFTQIARRHAPRSRTKYRLRRTACRANGPTS